MIHAQANHAKGRRNRASAGWLGTVRGGGTSGDESEVTRREGIPKNHAEEASQKGAAEGRHRVDEATHLQARTGTLFVSSDPDVISVFQDIALHLRSGRRTDNLRCLQQFLSDALDRAAQTPEGIRYLAHRPSLEQRLAFPPERSGQ